MRVLIVGLGGVTRIFRNWPERVIARDLVKRGHEVSAIGMLYPNVAGLTDERDVIDGVTVRRVPQAAWPNRALKAALEEVPRPDVVHLFHPRNLLAAQVTAWARRKGVPTVFTWLGPLHDEYLVADRERPFDSPRSYERLVFTRKELLARVLKARSPRAMRDIVRNYNFHWPLKAARHLIPCSRFEADELRRMGLDQPQTLVPLWIDEESLHLEGQDAPPLEASRPWILFVGQLTPRKGYDLALRALPQVVERYKNASLLVVSGINESDRARAVRMAQGLGVEGNVRFVGRLEDRALLALFRRCDIYLTPTRYEGFGLTLLEAMALEAAVVCSDVPAANEIVRDGENGLLCPPEDPPALARACLRILDDPSLAARLRAGGRRTLDSHYQPARLVDALCSAYSVVQKGPAIEDEAEYFGDQIRKSDRKIAIQYGRMFRLAGLGRRLPEGPVLDIGCGAGPGLRYLATRGAVAYGTDSSLYALERARELTPARGLLRTDARLPLPFKDSTFGLVLASEVIEHLPGGVEFLKECLRILRPSGMVLLTTPNLWDIRRITKPLVGEVWSGDTDPTHINMYSPGRLYRELVGAGFKRSRVVTGLKPMVWLPPYSSPWPIPYPPLIGNGIVATGMR